MGELKTIAWQGRPGTDIFKTAVAMAEIMAENGYYVQAFPQFTESRNCPSGMAFNRISDQPIRLHSQVEKADIIVILQADTGQRNWLELVHQESVTIFNSTSIEEVQNVMDIEESNIQVVDFDSIHPQRQMTGHSIPVLAVVIHMLHLISGEQLIGALEKYLLNKFNSDQVAECIKSANLALTGLKNNE
jgi:pyruvate ferredoxin oxidoreductase gamma subunit